MGRSLEGVGMSAHMYVDLELERDLESGKISTRRLFSRYRYQDLFCKAFGLRFFKLEQMEANPTR